MVVTAPWRTPVGRIHRTVEEHGDWVRKKVVELRDAPPPPPPPRWVEGEGHPFLGKEYPLRISQGSPRGVWLTDQELLVRVPDPRNRESIRKTVGSWVLEEARSLFTHRMETLVRSTPALGLQRLPTLSLRRMKSRWGSCSPRGRILMNTHAVKLPLPLVDYILMHELCHLKVPDHSQAFWTHLGACMPDWERRKRALDGERV